MGRPSLLASILSPEDFQDFGNELARLLYSKPNIIGSPEGKDHGIDGYDSLTAPSIIIQSKRVRGFSQANFDVEIEKIVEAESFFGWSEKPNYSLIVCTHLSLDKRKGFIDSSQGLIPGDEFLIDAKRIDELANDPKFVEVYKRYKLIDSSLGDLLRIERLRAIDAETELILADFSPHFFVQTNPFLHSLEVLLSDRILLVQGEPGVGKSTLTLALSYSFENISPTKNSVVCRGFNAVIDLIGLFNTDFKNSDGKLLMVFDDFLGRNSLSASENEINQLSKLCNLVEMNDNCYVILNSRTQILSQAVGADAGLEVTFRNKLEKRVIIVDLSKYSGNDKARILRALFLKSMADRSEVERAKVANYYEHLRIGKRYREIIEHRNYSPRLIELIISMEFEGEDFFDAIKAGLDNPAKLYNGLFDELSTAEKIFLFSLLQFNEQPIPLSQLQESLRPHEGNCEFDIDKILGKLSESWVKTKKANLKSETEIDFLNPGIIDFLNSKKHSLKNVIMEKSCLIAQLKRSVDEESLLWMLFEKNNTFLDFAAFSDEFFIAQLLFEGDHSSLLDELHGKMNEFNGRYSFYPNPKLPNRRANGWLNLVKVVQKHPSQPLRKTFCSILFDSLDSEVIQKRMLKSFTFEMDNFDNLVLVLSEMIYEDREIDLNDGKPESDANIAAFCDRVAYRKSMLIQDEIDNYQYSIFNINADDYVFEKGESPSVPGDLIESLLEEVLADSQGENLAIYESVESQAWDTSAIESFLEENMEAILREYEREDRAYEEWREMRYEVPQSGPAESVDDILDKPLL